MKFASKSPLNLKYGRENTSKQFVPIYQVNDKIYDKRDK